MQPYTWISIHHLHMHKLVSDLNPTIDSVAYLDIAVNNMTKQIPGSPVRYFSSSIPNHSLISKMSDNQPPM